MTSGTIDGFILTDSQLAARSSGTPLPFQTSAPRVFAVGDFDFVCDIHIDTITP